MAKLEIDNIYYNNLYFDYLNKKNVKDYIVQINTIVYNLNLIDSYISKLNSKKNVLNNYMYNELNKYYK